MLTDFWISCSLAHATGGAGSAARDQETAEDEFTDQSPLFRFGIKNFPHAMPLNCSSYPVKMRAHLSICSLWSERCTSLLRGRDDCRCFQRCVHSKTRVGHGLALVVSPNRLTLRRIRPPPSRREMEARPTLSVAVPEMGWDECTRRLLPPVASCPSAPLAVMG